jgi:hypothetical protein
MRARPESSDMVPLAMDGNRSRGMAGRQRNLSSGFREIGFFGTSRWQTHRAFVLPDGMTLSS